MNKLKIIFTFLVLTASLVLAKYGWCDLQEIKNCDVYFKCESDIDVRSMNSEIVDLFSKNWDQENGIPKYNYYVEVDSLIDPHYLNQYDGDIFKNIVGITLNSLSTIPDQIQKLENLEKFSVVYCDASELRWHIFLKFDHLTELNITYSGFETIVFDPTDEKKSKIDSMDLSFNSITTLQNYCFSHFVQLKYLNLSNNRIQTFNKFLLYSVNLLETLDLSYNILTEIWHDSASFVNLKRLFLNNNNLTSLTWSNFNSMVKLEHLHLNSNNIQFIDDDTFKDLSNLEHLDLSYNKLNYINKLLLWSNHKLHQLLLTNNNISFIEAEAFKRKNITSFDFSGNCLTGEVKKRVFDGISTDVLNLSSGFITVLEAESFSGLQARVLNLSNNILTTISATSFNQTELTDLDLSYNSLSSIEFESESLSKLSMFNARNNKITKVCKASLEYLVSLIELNLSHNKITELEPHSFDKLSSLQHLDLSYNLLSNPLGVNNFYGLSAVTKIEINHNRFIAIRNESFSDLKSLQNLNCSQGEIATLEYNSFQNTSLEILDLSYNLLNNFYINISSISTIKELYLNDNDIRNILQNTFSSLIKLEILSLANNEMINLEANALSSLNNLKTLDLSSVPDLKVEIVFTNSFHLRELKLTNLKNIFTFEHMKCNSSISRLDLSSNDIINVNAMFIFKINHIEYLDLHKNKITFVNEFSFHNMTALTELDLSTNKIQFIKPGSFLSMKLLKILNLHGNNLTYLRSGVFEGLVDLNILNISNNALNQFKYHLLPKTSKISAIALDNNTIKNINFVEFIHLSSIRLITIGGNPLSCHDISLFLHSLYHAHYTVTAINLDYHSENVDGISCISNSNSDHHSVLPDNNNKSNGKEDSIVMSRAIENYHFSVMNLTSAIDKMNLKNKFDGYRKNVDNTNGMLHFDAICLTILIVLFVFKQALKLRKYKNILQKGRMAFGGSNDEMADIIELQDS